MATADDVRASQAFVAAEQVNLSAAVDACKSQLAASSLDAWYALAGQCVHFVSREPVFGMVNVLAAEGAQIAAQLHAWRSMLESLGCAVPHLKEVPAPPPEGRPNPLFGALDSLGSALPFVLVLLAVREWNAGRK